MTNNLLNLKKDLKSFAKKCKDFKYTDSALLTFLLNGMLISTGEMFAETVTKSQINNQVSQINTSINQMRTDFKHARAENNKLIRDTNLELTQLMEQGDHVTKSPWSSWQFGINGFYSNWNGRYKGHGDKEEKYPYQGIFERSNDLYERSISPDSGQYNLLHRNRKPNFASGSSEGFGVASFKRVKEPIIPFEVNASINPRKVLKERISITAPTFTTPTAPETISFVPANPQINITTITPVVPDPISAPATGNGNESYILKTDLSNTLLGSTRYPNNFPGGTHYNPNDRVGNRAYNAIISQADISGSTITYNTSTKNVNINDGTIQGDGWNYSPSNYNISNYDGYEIIKNTGPYTLNITNSTITYDGDSSANKYQRWLFHTDAHNDTQASIWNINSGTTITVPNSGKYLAIYTSQFHNGSKNAIFNNVDGIIEDKGENNIIWISLSENARVHHKDSVFSNSGTIKLNGKNGIFAYIDTPTTIGTNGTGAYPWSGKGAAASSGNGDTGTTSNGWKITNSGTLNLGGSGNTGIFVNNNWKYHTAEINLTTPMTISGNENTGVYFKGWTSLDGKDTAGNASKFLGDDNANTTPSVLSMKITGTKSTGIYFNYEGTEGATDNSDTFNLTGTSTLESTGGGANAGNILIYNKAGVVNLGSSVTLKPNGEESVGIVNASGKATSASGPIDTTLNTAATITGTGKNAVAIYSAGAGQTTNTGTITLTGEGVKGIIADKTGAVINNDGNITVAGKEAVAVIARSNGTINMPSSATSTKTPTISVTGKSGLGLYATSNGTINATNTTVNASGGAINVYKNGGNITLKNSTLNTNADSLAFMTGGSGTIDFTSTDETTANINSKGTAFYYDGSATAGATGYADFSKSNIQSWASGSFNNLNKLKLNMAASDSRMFIASQVKMNLSDTNLTPANVASLFGSNSPQITGVTDYKTFLLYKSLLTIANTDTVNLDSNTDPYNLLEISNSSITNNGTINGTKAGQYAMAQTDDTNNASGNEWVKLINNGTITLSGSGSTGIYAKAGEVINNGTITVGDSSAGIYAVENTKVDNQKDITVGSKSTGIFYTDIFKDPVTGVETVFTTTTPLKNSGKITISGDDSVGMTYETDNIGLGAGLENAGTIIVTGDRNIAVYAKTPRTSGSYTTTNSGTITMGDSAKLATPNVALYTDATKSGVNPLVNTGKITVGNNAVGIYGYEADNSGDITVGDAGIGIYSQGGDINLTGGTIKTGAKSGKDEAVGVYTVGSGQTITNNGTSFDYGDDSFGFVNVGTNNKIYSNVANTTLKNNNVYIYSNDTSGTVVNKTAITSGAGAKTNYGIYSAGTVTNDADIDLSSGVGSVAIYSIKGGTATNNANITVGESDITAVDSNGDPAPIYSIGMGAGYKTTDTGNIVNKGTISINGKHSIGMYASGNGSTATNDGNIVLNASNTTGIYADHGATAINNGLITTGSGIYSNVVGVYLGKDTKLINNAGATIDINAKNGVGVYLKGGTIANYGTMRVNGSRRDEDTIYEFTLPSTGKEVGGVNIDAPSGATSATITLNGVPQIPVVVNTLKKNPISVSASSIGLYVNTSGVDYTKSIDGLGNLTSEADLIIGAEAAESTNSKYILVNDPNIINPYRAAILRNPNIKWNVYSGSIGWMATPTLDSNGVITSLYMAKIPYTEWAGRENTPINSLDTYNFADGLEQRYGVENLGTRERAIFTKLNSIGNNEEVLLQQSFDEMMGHQYGNTQLRINATGNLLDKEFKYLKHDWRNPSKQNNKIKAFGMRDEYKTDTAGIIDYTSNAYGVAYVHEDEKVKMGNSSGWYAGAVTNRFKFKDIGHSREDQTMVKLGIFKTMSPKKDYNGSLQWTIGGDVFAGVNNMKRKFLVVDDVFEAKSNYNSYGAALKTDLGYDIRMSERTHLRPYGGLKMEYGRFNNIKEDSGQMRLEVKGNDYFSVKPEAGVEFKYVQPLAVRTNLTVGLTAAYENELGKVGDVKNEGRVRYTTADWFGIRGEKEDRRGNGKFDLNIGVDNTRFGVTVNAGYDTKGSNIRGGIGFRAIY